MICSNKYLNVSKWNTLISWMGSLIIPYFYTGGGAAAVLLCCSFSPNTFTYVNLISDLIPYSGLLCFDVAFDINPIPFPQPPPVPFPRPFNVFSLSPLAIFGVSRISPCSYNKSLPVCYYLYLCLIDYIECCWCLWNVFYTPFRTKTATYLPLTHWPQNNKI